MWRRIRAVQAISRCFELRPKYDKVSREDGGRPFRAESSVRNRWNFGDISGRYRVISECAG